MAKLNTRIIRNFKKLDKGRAIQMLTCYDFQTAQILNETNVDIILVGDSVGNVVLGYDNTIKVTIDEMTTFSSAVKRGAVNKFVVSDLPFGCYSTLELGVQNATKLFQHTSVEAIKLEGAYPHHLEIIQRLTRSGIPIMGHIGLTPQSVHEQGGYFTHGKSSERALSLIQEAKSLEEAGVFCVVLECVTPEVAQRITATLNIPTIGIGSGEHVDGQVLVTNDLLGLGKGAPPKFVRPIANIYKTKKELINNYLKEQELKDSKIVHFNEKMVNENTLC